jgi:hypothetical protein
MVNGQARFSIRRLFAMRKRPIPVARLIWFLVSKTVCKTGCVAVFAPARNEIMEWAAYHAFHAAREGSCNHAGNIE